MPKASAVSVLIVDDQQSMRGICKYILSQLGFKDIIEAKSGRDALGKLEQSNVDLIISDWNMDDIDGLTLLKVIRKHPRTQAMPFIMATGRSGGRQQLHYQAVRRVDHEEAYRGGDRRADLIAFPIVNL
jgi:two-component system chemotaxis response regulator CheY